MTQDFQPFPAAAVAAKEAATKARSPNLPLPRPKVTAGTPQQQQIGANGVPAPGPQAAPHFADQPGSSIIQQLRATTSPEALGVATHVPVPALGVGVPVSAAEAINLDMPSKFAFYSFKDLYVKPFRGVHLAKLSRGHAESSILPIVEAVSSVLSTSNELDNKALAFRLTMPDFYFVLYWLRQNSFTKSIYTHTTYCDNPDHIKEVEAKTKPPESLKIVEQIRASRLVIKPLEQMPNPDAFVLEHQGVFLRPALMIDTIELTEDDEAANPEFQYLGRRACFLGIPGKPDASLRERIALVGEMGPDDLNTITGYEKAINDYGVVETITVRCSGCGAKRDTKLTLDAHSFLSA